jgi:LacI family transcriptional regulator
MSLPKVTLREVANEAGVSIATASRALGGYAPVNEEIKKRVFEAARKLHYQHNLVAKNLRTRRTFTIGYLLPDITNPFYAGIARGIQDVAGSRGYSVILCNNDNDPAKTERFGKMLLRHRVEGIIYSTPYNEALLEMVETAAANGIPVVNCYGSTRVPSQDLVWSDASLGCYRGMRYLLELGHREIAILKVKGSGVSERRLEGCRKALEEFGVPFDPSLVIEAGDYSQKSGYLSAKIFLGNRRKPSALLSFNEQLSIGALKAAREVGVRIPQDLSVIAVDDIIAEVLEPPLTAIAIPKYEAGEITAALLLERIEQGDNVSSRQIILEEKLVVWSSTQVPRKKEG